MPGKERVQRGNVGLAKSCCQRPGRRGGNSASNRAPRARNHFNKAPTSARLLIVATVAPTVLPTSVLRKPSESDALWQQLLRRKVQILFRVKSHLVLRLLRRLADGSYLANIYPSPTARELASLGSWVRSDGTAQETASNGYATGLVLHVLQTVGISKENEKVAKGLDWLKHHQSASGAWWAVSVNKKRYSFTHSGKFMSDAATAYAVLALSH
jgi:hypothetical protein